MQLPIEYWDELATRDLIGLIERQTDFLNQLKQLVQHRANLWESVPINLELNDGNPSKVPMDTGTIH